MFARTLTFTILVFLLSFSPTTLKAEPIVALTTNNEIVLFDTTDPATLDDTLTLSGLQSGEQLVGIDFRPANDTLYAVGDSSRLYTIDLSSGAATAISAVPFTTTLSGTSFGVDFNPVADLLRIISDTGQNIRIDPSTGTVSALDTALAYSGSDVNSGTTPALAAIAYDNNFVGAATATLYGVDATLNTLVLLGGAAGSPSPNGGTLFTEGSIGVDTTVNVGFDVSPVSGEFYISMTRSGQTASELYRLRLGTGLPITRLGAVTSTTTLRDIAVPFLDTAAPTIAVRTPSASTTRTRASRVTFSGSASDNVRLATLQYRVRKGGHTSNYANANGTTSWSFTVSGLPIGRSTITIKATDLYGNERTVTRTINRVRR